MCILCIYCIWYIFKQIDVYANFTILIIIIKYLKTMESYSLVGIYLNKRKLRRIFHLYLSLRWAHHSSFKFITRFFVFISSVSSAYFKWYSCCSVFHLSIIMIIELHWTHFVYDHYFIACMLIIFLLFYWFTWLNYENTTIVCFHERLYKKKYRIKWEWKAKSRALLIALSWGEDVSNLLRYVSLMLYAGLELKI